MSFNRIHHLNYLVRDLDQALPHYADLFQPTDILFDELSTRGVRTARFRVGETWIVLVQPTRDDSIPGQHLATRGEGVFLIAYAVENLDRAAAALAARGIAMDSKGPRQGVANWRVWDVASALGGGVTTQLCEEQCD